MLDEDGNFAGLAGLSRALIANAEALHRDLVAPTMAGHGLRHGRFSRCTRGREASECLGMQRAAVDRVVVAADSGSCEQ